MHALEIHVITLDNTGRSEIRAVTPTGQVITKTPGVPLGPDALDQATNKIRALLPDADRYAWNGLWKYEPTRREVRNVMRLWAAEPARS